MDTTQALQLYPELTTAQAKVVSAWDGSISSTAEAAGVDVRTVMGALRHSRVRKALADIAELEGGIPFVASPVELKEFWTEIMRNNGYNGMVRLRASENLAKIYLLFPDKMIVEGGDTPINVTSKVNPVDLEDRLKMITGAVVLHSQTRALERQEKQDEEDFL